MTTTIRLREVLEEDLPIFFDQQRDPDGVHMAAFTVKDPSDWSAYLVHWTRILDDPIVTMRTILLGEEVVGSILCFQQFGETEVSYWLGKDYWGRGLATQALAEFLKIVTTRPLVGRTAADNVASRRVMEKCGFQVIGVERGYANARSAEIDEYVLKLTG
jgi:RimJ/RimL family protein N-acetyltransferase